MVCSSQPISGQTARNRCDGAVASRRTGRRFYWTIGRDRRLELCTLALALAFALDGSSFASVAPLLRLLTWPAIVLVDVCLTRPVAAIAAVGIRGFLFR